MRRVRYSVAASLDGYIADANGGFDWIPHDPTVDFAALFDRIDTVLMGRRTYEVMQSQSGPAFKAGTRVYVVSRTLAQDALNPDIGLAQLNASKLEHRVDHAVDGGRDGAEDRYHGGLDQGRRNEAQGPHLDFELEVIDQVLGERAGEVMG